MSDIRLPPPDGLGDISETLGRMLLNCLLLAVNPMDRRIELKLDAVGGDSVSAVDSGPSLFSSESDARGRGSTTNPVRRLRFIAVRVTIFDFG